MPSSTAELGLTQEQVKKFQDDGLLAVEGFLSEAEADEMRSACVRMVDEVDPSQHRGVFSTSTHPQVKGRYFLDSATKVHYFFETDSFDEATGELLVPKQECIHKIGHAMHWFIPEFKKVTFSDKMKAVSRSLGLKDPAVVQGMYIFKLPRVGSAATPHQDGTFLTNDPLNLVGAWFALDDATLENGCLWYAPGSHRNPVTRYMLRNPDADGAPLIFEGENPEVADEDWVAAPVKKGTLVLIHGQVMHKSEPNLSPYPRHAYTFHMVETEGSKWSDRSWLQPTPEFAFPKLYEN